MKKHRHELRADEVQTPATIPLVTPQTVVLWRCLAGGGCEHVETTVLAGRWTLGQVRGEAEPDPVTGSGQVLPAKTDKTGLTS